MQAVRALVQEVLPLRILSAWHEKLNRRNPFRNTDAAQDKALLTNRIGKNRHYRLPTPHSKGGIGVAEYAKIQTDSECTVARLDTRASL